MSSARAGQRAREPADNLVRRKHGPANLLVRRERASAGVLVRRERRGTADLLVRRERATAEALARGGRGVAADKEVGRSVPLILLRMMSLSVQIFIFSLLNSFKYFSSSKHSTSPHS